MVFLCLQNWPLLGELQEHRFFKCDIVSFINSAFQSGWPLAHHIKWNHVICTPRIYQMEPCNMYPRIYQIERPLCYISPHRVENAAILADPEQFVWWRHHVEVWLPAVEEVCVWFPDPVQYVYTHWQHGWCPVTLETKTPVHPALAKITVHLVRLEKNADKIIHVLDI